MKSILKLHPHKHTGKLLHHRHTSYPALFLLLAIAGAVMLMPIGMARADSYVVNAIVPAPLPNIPAHIDFPTDGSSLLRPNITVTGTCPVIDPPIIVVLYDGTMILGSQFCVGGGTFSIPVSLEQGAHSLTVHTMNFTGQNGPPGNTVTVYFNPSNLDDAASTTANISGDGGDSTSGPEIVTDTPFIVYGPGKDAVWKGTFRGGAQPYGLTIDWGDGSIQTRHNVKAGNITLRHRYQTAKMYQVRLELRDKQGHTAGISLIALSPAAYAGTSDPNTGLGGGSVSAAWLLYVAYVLTVVGLIAFWRRERGQLAFQPALIPVAKRRRSTTRRRR